jgi:hypothetical protein
MIRWYPNKSAREKVQRIYPTPTVNRLTLLPSVGFIRQTISFSLLLDRMVVGIQMKVQNPTQSQRLDIGWVTQNLLIHTRDEIFKIAVLGLVNNNKSSSSAH